jgi:hypothetical protein
MVAGISITKWGPAGWHLLHTISYSYPKEPNDVDKQNMYSFMHSFAKVLPCKKCRVDFTGYVRKHLPPNSPALDSRDAFVVFVHSAHNHVNMKLGKPAYELARSKHRFLVNDDPLNPCLVVAATAIIIFIFIRNRLHKYPERSRRRSTSQ